MQNARRTSLFTLKLSNTLIALLFSSITCNVAAKSQGDYLQHEKFTTFLNTVVTEDGHDKQTLLTLFKDASRKESILKAIARPAEKRLTWAKYQDIFLTQKRVEKGVSFYKKHKSSLQQAHKDYGVPPEIILAIIGVETRYGGNKGSYRVIDSLSTLAFDYPPRSKFFTKQLRQYLLLGKEAGIDLKTTTGSYAGAMGFPQFIPSSYRHYAVDFDNDNVTDLINNPVDAIGSVGNYFSKHGWVSNAPITSPARFLKTDGKETDLDNIVNQGLKPILSIKEISNAGLVGDKTYNPDAKATAMRLKGKQGNEYWLGLKNFYVITRYNHSKLYAMAVYQLSESLKPKITNL